MGKWATMDTIWSRFRPWLSCEDICLLNTPPNGRHSQHSAVILLMEPLDNQGTFVPCAARILWYSADKTSSRQLRDTTGNRINSIEDTGTSTVISNNFTSNP